MKKFQKPLMLFVTSMIFCHGLCFAGVFGQAKAIKTIVLLGPPGSGKGTLAAELEKTEGLSVITVSQVLKNQMTKDANLEKKVKGLMDSGKFVSDDIILEVLAKELKQKKYSKGVIFDGFPRTLNQCEFFKTNNMKIDLVIVMDIEDDAIVRRMQGRRVHMASGRMYHIDSMPPKVEGKDDLTGEDLVQREDDKEEIVMARLEDYHNKTEPIVGWAIQESEEKDGLVETVVKLDAEFGFDEVLQNLCKKVRKKSLSLNLCSETSSASN